MTQVFCEWCGKLTGSDERPYDIGRLVRHKGKYEVWCNPCVAEDARGLPSSLRSKESVKRKKDRRHYEDP